MVDLKQLKQDMKVAAADQTNKLVRIVLKRTEVHPVSQRPVDYVQAMGEFEPGAIFTKGGALRAYVTNFVRDHSDAETVKATVEGVKFRRGGYQGD